ncbi:MAG: ribonuclease H family protein [Christensenellaceae bacterium]|jgi:ribonuclease HI|nr:ribonuclease H family protein [Christensenellaceae bacterium]
MAKQKYYAVKKGHKTGIFLTWDECRAATESYADPVFRSFNSKIEANAYLSGEDLVMENDILPRVKQGIPVAFTDGSYNIANDLYGGGAVIFVPPTKSQDETNTINNSKPECLKFIFKGTIAKYSKHKNIAGEIIAGCGVIKWAIDNGYTKIAIFHDLIGLSEWALGKWKTNCSVSRDYKAYIDTIIDKIELEFVKVSGHSNNKYNDIADELAKQSVI